MRTASCPFLSWLKPRFVPWAPLPCPICVGSKKEKKKEKGVYTTKRSVETVPSVSLGEQVVTPE